MNRGAAIRSTPSGLIAGLICALGFLASSAGAATTLRTAAAIRHLDSATARMALPVDIDAIVTYYNGRDGLLFVHDSTAGIYVETTRPLNIVPGSLVSIRGITLDGFTPSITNAMVRELSRGAPPRPRPVTIVDLLSARLDCEYVTFSGEVRSASVQTDGKHSFLDLRIENQGRFIDVQLMNYADPKFDSIIGSTVQVTGPVGGDFNADEQLTAIVVYAQNPGDINILKPAQTDPFDLPVVPVGRLLKYRSDIQFGLRTHVRGAVTYIEPGQFIIVQQDRDGVLVRTRQSTPLAVGDTADVVGFADFGEASPILNDASYRALTPSGRVEPAHIAPNLGVARAFDSKLVSLDADLLNVAGNAGKTTLSLSGDGVVFSAALEAAVVPQSLARLRPGSRLRLTGICILDTAGLWKSMRGFHLLLRSAGDIGVLESPSWWDAGRLIYALSGLFATVLAAFGWVAVLRHRVAAQTAEISREARLQKARSRVLEMINNREPLPDVLQAVSTLLEMSAPGSAYCIHLRDGDHLKLVPQASSPEIARLLARVSIHRGNEICAQAAAAGDAILHPQACARAVPDGSGGALGAISIYEGTQPLPEHLSGVLDLTSQLVALAIHNRELYDGLTHRSRHDPLTGLPNRVFLDEHLSDAVQSNVPKRFAIAYIDLDEFKKVNDVHGHKTGDTFLQIAAARLRSALREQDLLARIGGDEFIAVLTAVDDRGEATARALRLVESLREPFAISASLHLPCTASIGVAIFPEDGASVDDLKNRADESMYRAKTSGKNQVQTLDHASYTELAPTPQNLR